MKNPGMIKTIQIGLRLITIGDPKGNVVQSLTATQMILDGAGEATESIHLTVTIQRRAIIILMMIHLRMVLTPTLEKAGGHNQQKHPHHVIEVLPLFLLAVFYVTNDSSSLIG